MCRNFLFFVLLTLVAEQGHAQEITNTDPTQTYINVNTPRSPESAGFEKYSAAQVSEFTGTNSVNVPICTLKSRFLQLPITLSYQATGIKVNQEASWVGLGWDLNAGGRITVEVRGCADFSGATHGLTNPGNLAAGMKQIFNRLGGSSDNAVLTPSTICDDDIYGCPMDTSSGYDNTAAVEEMAEYGTGEPDIFRANFMGHSLTFFVDKISNGIHFIGEQSLFKINYTLDGNYNITAWTIVDDDGITYYFNQTETTTNTYKAGVLVPSTSTSAWLLTRVVHPSGDYIQFTYNNYGYTAPAFTMMASVQWSNNSPYAPAVLSTDYNQNVALQTPYYLTRVESAEAAVNFTLDTRTDLYGPGARKLTQITVSDKATGNVVQTANLHYSYFQSSYNPWASYLSTLSYYLPSPLTTSGYLACSSSRLRLDSIHNNLSTYQPPYRFYYNTNVPDKYSYSQDHWGYLNNANNIANGYGFTHLIPYSGTGGVGNGIPAAYLSTNNIGSSRDCDPGGVQAMMLTSVVYPTGGSTSFIYEPHQSSTTTSVFVQGGGVRIKSINNYESGNLVGTTNYTYAGGKYMGVIKYATNQNELPNCATSNTGAQLLIKYSSSGAVNFSESQIGYAQITITQQSPIGQSNGALVKTFYISTPSSNYSSGTGFDLAPPTYPAGFNVNNPAPYSFYLDPTNKDFPPTAAGNLEGQLLQEQYFDSSNNLIKSVTNYYHLANYSNAFYDIRAIENRLNGFNFGGSCQNPDEGELSGGNRPAILFVSPAKSYHTLKDSVVELTYNGGNYVTKKTAYVYNPYYQPMFETLYNSDNTQTINYTRTSAEIYIPQASGPSGLFATQMYQMETQHVLNLPIEQTIIHRGTAGDSSVISSRFNVYQNALPLQVYEMESAQPLALRSQFIPWYYNLSSSYSVNIDSHYSLYTTADYSPGNMVWTLHTLAGNKAYIWDEGHNTLLAGVANADSANVAFTSFETNATGRWSYNSLGTVPDASAPTGSNSYGLSSGSISLNGLTAATTYVVSYWSKTGSPYAVSGSVSIKQGKTIKGWTYFEVMVSGVTSVTISGAGSIDEVRLYPSSAQMTSYTYAPLVGMTSQCDVNNRITYYSYDAIGRLQYIKDQDANIIKTFLYHYESSGSTQY